jgi:hypothetical protein
MTRRCPSRFVTLGLVLILPLLLVTTPLSARVITVGQLGEVQTIDAAVAKAEVGDEIVLDRNAEYGTRGLKITLDGLEFRSADGEGVPAIITNLSKDKNAITLDHRAEGLMLKDLILAGGDNVTCVMARGRRLTVDNVRPTNTVWRFVQLRGAQQTLIRNCEAPVLTAYTVCAFDADARGLIIDHCTFLGSEKEHTVRLQRIYDAVIRNSTLKVGGWKSAITIRDGADNRVENCTIDGPISIGPLADADGGIKLPASTPEQQARREQMLRRTSRNVTFKNCTIDTPSVTVEMGVQNLVFEGCRIATSKSSVLRLARDEYEPWRNIPTGAVIDCALTGPADLRLFHTDRRTFTVQNTTLNGARLPDVTRGPATRQSDSGGATPGEVIPPPPVTTPTTRPTVLRFDLIDAASGAVVCELTDGAALPTTLPAAAAALNVLLTTDPPRVGSLRVVYDGASRIERTAPYTIGSPSLAIAQGTHVVEATPFTGDNATGLAGPLAKITFTRPPAPPPTTQPSADPVIRHDDLLAALASVNDALADLTAARQHLTAATQPTR